MTTHLNIAARTRWPNDEMPACECDGDKPDDHYTTDRSRVTCDACRYVILAPQIDRGEVCPHCKRGGHITRVRALSLPLFVCGCGAQWFDSVTLHCEEA